jgi:hypothetical protein
MFTDRIDSSHNSSPLDLNAQIVSITVLFAVTTQGITYHSYAIAL